MILLTAAALGGVCSELLNLSPTIGYLVGGMAVGPSGLSLVEVDVLRYVGMCN